MFREGYARFRREELPAERELLASIAAGSKPKALLISCSDSRVMTERLVGARPGDLFRVLNIANQVASPDESPSAAAAVVFCVEILQVPRIILCGHYGCLGVRTALGGLEGVSEPLRSWLKNLLPLAARTAHLHAEPEEQWKAAVEENVRLQLDRLRGLAAVRGALAAGRLELHGWVYDMRGGLKVLDPSSGEFHQV